MSNAVHSLLGRPPLNVKRPAIQMNTLLPPGEDQKARYYHPKAEKGSISIKQDPKRYTRPYQTRKNDQPHPNDLLPISVVHKGHFRTDSLTQPRNPNGELVTMMPLSMGSWQAGADMSDSPVGVGLSNMNSRGMYAWPQKRVEQI